VPLALRLAPPVAGPRDTIGDVLRRAATTAPDVVALVDGVADPASRTRTTYAQLLADAESLARTLAADFAPGERLAVALPTVPESLRCTYAAALAGLVLVPVNPLLRAHELAHVLGQSGAAGIVCVGDHRGHDVAGAVAEVRDQLPALRAVVDVAELEPRARRADPSGALPEVAPDAIAQIVFTSGTTGAPKGACLSHAGMTHAARAGATRFDIREGDVYVDPLPLFHVGGQGVALEIAHARATYVLVRAFDPALVLDLVEQERGTLTVAVPTMLGALLADEDLRARDLASLRAISSGGALVPAALVRRVRDELGASVTIVFGQTECCGFISQTRLDDPPELVEATLGTPLDGVDVRVVDPATGDVVQTGEEGELEVRGPNVMVGYHDRPDATAEAFHDGWLRTGDLVTLDDAGSLRITGRLKDMIVTGGVNVYAAEVEGALLADPAVVEAAVFGVPDDHWGERVVAAVRLDPAPADADAEAAALDAVARRVAERLAPYKRPKQWTAVRAMPVTPYGKVQKFRLREQLGTPAPPAGAAGGT
jgi:fatty-acyl-CoA synthase